MSNQTGGRSQAVWAKRLMLAGLAVALAGCGLGVALAVLLPGDAALLAVLPTGLGIGAGALLILGGFLVWVVNVGVSATRD